MKDYHDMIMILLTPDLLAKEKTKNALVATFAHRETKINTPMLQFNNQEIEQLQLYWNAYLRKTKSQTDLFSRPFGDIVEHINKNVLGILS